MRKFLAIFLTVAMLASFAVVPALAVTYTVKDTPNRGDAKAVNEINFDTDGTDFFVFYEGTTVKDVLAAGTATGDFYLDVAGDATIGTAGTTRFLVDAAVDPTYTGSHALAGKSLIKITAQANAAATAASTGVAIVNIKEKGASTDTVVKTIVLTYKAKSTTPDAATSIKIEKPDSTVLVAGDSIVLKLDDSAAKSASAAMWFSSNEDVYFPNYTAGDMESSITVKADPDIETGTVTIKAISGNALVDTIELFVVEGRPATTFKFTDAKYSVAASAGKKVVLKTATTPSNGAKTDLKFEISGANVTTNGTPGVTVGGIASPVVSDYKVEVKTGKYVCFNLSASGEVEVIAADNTLIAADYPALAVVKASITGKGDVTIVDTAILEIGKPATTASRFIKLDKTPALNQMVIGDKFQVGASVWDDNPNLKTAVEKNDVTLIWKSSNPAVAKVDKDTGVITAVDKGKATIWAESKDAGKAAPYTAGDDEFVLTVVKKADIEGTAKYVRSGSLAVRSKADYKSDKVGTLPQGQLVYVVDEVGIYSKIVFAGTYGYVASEYLGAPVNFSVTSSKLAVRSFPGATETLTTLVYGDNVNVIGTYTKNPAWTMILLENNTVAYVATKYITEGTQLGIVTSGTLTMRVSASTTSAAYANKLVKGQTVEILGKEGAFLKVKTAEGFVGYAAASYITIL